MTGTDFFDEDLHNREAADWRSPAGDAPNVINRPVSDLNLTRMARRKEDVEQQVASSARELDRLRMRQEEVERERKELEDLRKNQEGYERGRREVTDGLNKSLIMKEREQLRVHRLLESLNGTREAFRRLLLGIESVDPEAWPDERVREELSKALVVVDEARVEYNKGIAKVEALLEDGQRMAASDLGVMPGDRGGVQAGASFGFWLKAGLAFCLPLIATLLVLATAYVVLKQRGSL